jgi:hypothetical protein
LNHCPFEGFCSSVTSSGHRAGILSSLREIPASYFKDFFFKNQ